MPTVVLDKQDWSENFKEVYYKMSLDKVSDHIKMMYDEDQSHYYTDVGALEYVKKLDDDTAMGWMRFLNSFEGSQSKSNVAKINTYTTTKYKDFIDELGRSHLAREDFESVLTNKHKFRVIYTDDDTYLTKDPAFEPDDSCASGLGLFEGL